jgi:hypothetical protein
LPPTPAGSAQVIFLSANVVFQYELANFLNPRFTKQNAGATKKN